MNGLKFSVAISVYKNDNPIFFDRALQSITELQTVMPDEIVLVVDGPVGEALDGVIHKYQEAYDFFNIIRLSQNGGLGNALKLAVENARNEIIARMDSDDVCVPTRFEQQLRFFVEDDTLDVVGGDISEFIGAEENIVAYRKVPCGDGEIKEYLKKRCPLNHVSVMYKKSAVQTWICFGMRTTICGFVWWSRAQKWLTRERCWSTCEQAQTCIAGVAESNISPARSFCKSI